MNDMDGCMQAVSKVFGVHSLCPAVEMEKGDFNAICDQAVRMMQGLRGSFKVEARRADKRYPMTSPEINMQMGGYILERCPDLHVDIHTPEHVMNVEIRDRRICMCACWRPWAACRGHGRQGDAVAFGRH